jgi:hypothetical protein
MVQFVSVLVDFVVNFTHSNTTFSLLLPRSKIRLRDLIMPPEQLMRRRWNVLSKPSIIWAVGLLVVHLMTGMNWCHCCVHLLLDLFLGESGPTTAQILCQVISCIHLHQLTYMIISITSKPEVLCEADQAHSHRDMLEGTRRHGLISIINNRKPIIQRAWQQDNFRMSIVQRLILQGFKQQYRSSTMIMYGRMHQGAEQ